MYPYRPESALGVFVRSAQTLGGLFARNQHEALELGHERAVLVQYAGVDLDRAAVELGARLPDLEHLGLGEQRVAVENRRGVAQLLRGQVGDRLPGDVADAHAEREAVDVRADDDV